MLAACGGSNSPSVPLAATQLSDAERRPSVVKSAANTFGNLYVANNGNNTVTVYAPGRVQPLRTISNGISDPWALAFDSSGNLYVLNNIYYDNGDVTVYPPGSTSPSETITQGTFDPYNLVIDRHDNLYVSGIDGVSVYAPGTTSPKQTITDGISDPQGMAFDSVGNLYVANFHNQTVTVYRPGDRARIRTISQGNNSYPKWVGVDPAGNLYVACMGYYTYYIFSSVNVYARGGHKLIRSLDSISDPWGFAFDAAGNVYVANCGSGCFEGYTGGDVTVYAPGSKSVLRTIDKNGPYPHSLAFSPTGNLFVANEKSIAVYEMGTKKRLRMITKGVTNPFSLAFGP